MIRSRATVGRMAIRPYNHDAISLTRACHAQRKNKKASLVRDEAGLRGTTPMSRFMVKRPSHCPVTDGRRDGLRDVARRRSAADSGVNFAARSPPGGLQSMAPGPCPARARVLSPSWHRY